MSDHPVNVFTDRSADRPSPTRHTTKTRFGQPYITAMPVRSFVVYDRGDEVADDVQSII